MKHTFLIVGVAALFSTAVSVAAKADPVTGTLSATYYEVLNNGSGAPDFGGSGTPNVAIGSGLVNDRPVVSTTSPGVSMYDHSTGELLWWTASATVIQTGTGTVSLPYSSTMYAPNSTGTNDANAFETAVLTGTFTLSSAGAVHFTVGSDDDAFVYLNGVLIGQNPGIHAITDVTFAGNANAGVNTLEIFYADRERTGAQLDVSADVALTAAVPEPSTWAMMILGFFGVGSLAYRRKSQARASAGLAPTLIFFATWEKQLPPGNLTLPGVFVRRPGFSRSKPVVDVGGAIEREIGTLSPTDSLKRCSRCGTRLEV